MQINMNHWAKYESSSITIKAQWRYLAYCSVPFKSWLRAAKTSGPRLLRACPCARMKLSVSSIKWPETPPENFSTNPNIMGHVIANVISAQQSSHRSTWWPSCLGPSEQPQQPKSSGGAGALTPNGSDVRPRSWKIAVGAGAQETPDQLGC